MLTLTPIDEAANLRPDRVACFNWMLTTRLLGSWSTLLMFAAASPTPAAAFLLEFTVIRKEEVCFVEALTAFCDVLPYRFLHCDEAWITAPEMGHSRMLAPGLQPPAATQVIVCETKDPETSKLV
jgi:hypothetical protein